MNKIKNTARLICAVFFLSGCFVRQTDDVSNFTSWTRHTTAAFGTVSVLHLYEDFSRAVNVARFERVWSRTGEILRELDSVFSLHNPASDVARFNALAYGESIEVNIHMARIIKKSKAVYDAMGGFFDPTVFPLVDLWGFTPRFRLAAFTPLFPYDRPLGQRELPAPEYIEGFTRLVGLAGLVLEGDERSGFTLTKRIPPVIVNGVTYQAKLDFAAIAKGYAADLIRDVMIQEGFRFGFFSCGGSSMALLYGMDHISPDDGVFQFALRLRKPRPGRNYDSAFISILAANTNLSTSGDYGNAFFLDGIRYSHIFDPRTGRPINSSGNGLQSGIAAVTVLGENGAFAEGFSTGLLVKTLSEAIAFINRLEGYKVVLVYYKTGHEYFEIITNIPAELMTILDPAYVLASRMDAQGNVIYTGNLQQPRDR